MLVIATAGTGIALMALLLGAQGMRPIEWFMLLIFTLPFSLLCVSFWSTMTGLFLRFCNCHPVTLSPIKSNASTWPPLAPTALVMPVYNEDTASVVHCLASTWQSLMDTGEANGFDVFLLSDSTASDQRIAERNAIARLRSRFGSQIRLYYRARANNEGRKPGNIRDFCERWGNHYQYMVVLDADSRMTGEAILTLVRRMQANPQAGIIQTVPLPVGQRTVLGRFQQLGASVQAHAIATGLAFWQGNSTNYWGHNAIIRVRDFQDYCGLEKLPGSPPLGGDVMSHDYVEAGLMRRHGRGVYVLPEIEGSFEGMPGNFVDDLKRERRWCQGNLQHLRLLAAPGWRAITRLNFLLGGLAYVNAPLWLALMGVGVFDALTSASSAWQMTVSDGGRTAGSLLVALTLTLLFIPRLLSIGTVIASTQAAGHRVELARGGLLELGFSILRGPLMMLLYSGYITRILSGRPAGWQTGLRGRRRVTLSDGLKLGGPIALIAIAIEISVLWHDPILAIWLLPALAGPMLYPLILILTSRTAPMWLPPTIEERRGEVPVNRLARRWYRNSDHSKATAPASTRWQDTPPERFRGMPLQPLF
jgi:membrane glycosyltransferase